MGHKRLGRSAIVVSDICMGTMTFGGQADEAMAHRILDKSFEAGINSGGRGCLDRDRRWLSGISADCVSPVLARHAGRA